MGRVILFVVCAALLAAPAATASPPQAVTISSNLFFATESGTFTATGDVICPSGTIENVGTLFVGFQSGRAAQILARHEFTCADGSGSFVLQLTAALDFEDGTSEFGWSVLKGTGDYSKLHGTGAGTGGPIAGGVHDDYSGAMHID